MQSLGDLSFKPQHLPTHPVPCRIRDCLITIVRLLTALPPAKEAIALRPQAAQFLNQWVIFRCAGLQAHV